MDMPRLLARPTRVLTLTWALLGALILFAPSCRLMDRTPKEDLIVITTEMGTIELLLSDRAPQHKANFLKLARQGYYDGTTFHRIIKGFMIQGGDPNSKDEDPSNDGNGGPGYTIPAELNSGLRHIQGAVAAARLGDGANPTKASSGSQFYIVENRDGAHFLDANYTVFGQVIHGIETVERIAEQKKNPTDRPLKDIRMQVRVRPMTRAQITREYGYAFDSANL